MRIWTPSWRSCSGTSTASGRASARGPDRLSASAAVPARVRPRSSDYGARLAALRGLPYAFAHHFSSRFSVPAMHLYRDGFQPSEVQEQPHAILTVTVVCADTDERAHSSPLPGRSRSCGSGPAGRRGRSPHTRRLPATSRRRPSTSWRIRCWRRGDRLARDGRAAAGGADRDDRRGRADGDDADHGFGRERSIAAHARSNRRRRTRAVVTAASPLRLADIHR